MVKDHGADQPSPLGKVGRMYLGTHLRYARTSAPSSRPYASRPGRGRRMGRRSCRCAPAGCLPAREGVAEVAPNRSSPGTISRGRSSISARNARRWMARSRIQAAVSVSSPSGAKFGCSRSVSLTRAGSAERSGSIGASAA